MPTAYQKRHLTRAKCRSVRCPASSRPFLLELVTSAVLFALTSTAFADYEAASFGVNNYGGTGECCSGCADLENPAIAAGYVINELDDVGYTDLHYWTNKQVDGWDWCDGPGCGDETSPYGTDFADVVFFSGHGDHICTSTDHFSRIYMGDGDDQPNDTCFPTTEEGNPGESMEFGDADGDANIIIMHACRSVEFCVWESHGYDYFLKGQANILAGYHGDSYDSLWNSFNIAAYVDASETDGLGDNWNDAMEFDPIDDTSQCPVVLVYGNTPAERRTQFDSGGFKDFKNTGTHSGSTYFYECECDPSNGAPLPDCD